MYRGFVTLACVFVSMISPNKRFESQSPDYSICTVCPNPRGRKCEYELCRACCRKKTYHEVLDCEVTNENKFLG